MADPRSPARRRSLPGLWFTVQSVAEKMKIDWQDQRGSYKYARWIKTVERPALARALNEKVSGDAPSVCVFSVDDLASLSPRQMLDWLAEESADWVMPVQTGDQLSPHFADLFHRCLVRHPEAGLVYWDEDILTRAGQRFQPFFKPDWSPELLFSRNYLECAAYHKDLLRAYLTAQPAEQAGWVFDLTRLAHEVAHIPFVLQHRVPAARSAGVRQHAAGLQAFLERSGFQEAAVTVGADHRVRARWTVDCPLVSIIIPTRNNLSFLKRCLSTLLEKTSGAAYEVLIMDDHSGDPAVQAYYRELQSEHANIRVYENEGSFNYSRVNNRGAALAKGELLLFLNNDVEILSGGWLVELARWALMPGVGMVGARLLYPNRAIQHAGIVVGLTGHGGHLFAGKLTGEGSLFVSPEEYRNVSAVTGACMLVRRDVFEQVGGFNEDFLLVFNDIEIGLRVLKSGHRVVYTPAAELIHYEGRSRARYIPPQDVRLGTELLSDYIRQGDPYYNPNLSRAVNWPTLRRKEEMDPAKRLELITRFKG